MWLPRCTTALSRRWASVERLYSAGASKNTSGASRRCPSVPGVLLNSAQGKGRQPPGPPPAGAPMPPAGICSVGSFREYTRTAPGQGVGVPAPPTLQLGAFPGMMVRMAAITIIGAGSARFSLDFIRDLCATPSLWGGSLTFMDIDRERLDLGERLARRYCPETGADYRIAPTTDPRRALEGAE